MLSSVFTDLGIPAKIYDETPTDETAYAASTTPLTATPLPDWATVEPLLAAKQVAVKHAQISAERTRRIALGTMATVTGIGSFLVDTRDEVDFRNINGLTAKGIVLSMSGDTTTTVTFRDANNVDRVMNGAQLIEFGASIGNVVDVLYKKSWALKAMDPIPDDITDDQYWT